MIASRERELRFTSLICSAQHNISCPCHTSQSSRAFPVAERKKERCAALNGENIRLPHMCSHTKPFFCFYLSSINAPLSQSNTSFISCDASTALFSKHLFSNSIRIWFILKAFKSIRWHESQWLSLSSCFNPMCMNGHQKTNRFLFDFSWYETDLCTFDQSLWRAHRTKIKLLSRNYSRELCERKNFHKIGRSHPPNLVN